MEDFDYRKMFPGYDPDDTLPMLAMALGFTAISGLVIFLGIWLSHH